MGDKKVWIIVVTAVVIACLCMTTVLVAGVGLWRFVEKESDIFSKPGDEDPLLPLDPSEEGQFITPVQPNATPEPADSGAYQTLNNLREAEVPINDPLDLAERLLGVPDIPLTVEPSEPYQVGDRETFWASNTDTNETFRVNAVLREVVDSAYFWIEDGVSYRPKDLTRLAETFNNEIYPTNRAFFGSEWTPGIDGDPHLYILYAHNLGESTAAYYSSIDSVNPLAHQYSNAHEMFMINADTVTLGEEYTYGVLAHEFQHMIHWNNDRNEDTWVNEGFAELASFLNGYDPGGFDYLFSLQPDSQLNDWPQEPNLRSINYGSSFLFMAYFLDRYGEQATQALVSESENSMESVDLVLKDLAAQGKIMDRPASADDLFTDWTITNYLDDPAFADGRFAYQRYTSLAPFPPTESIGDCSGEWQQRTVSQYGTDYIELTCSGQVELTIQGASEVGVLPQGAQSGDFAFWSNGSDESNMRLTQTFDFSNARGQLTFDFSVWYNLETDYDYLYLSASTDGSTWEILETPSCTYENPSGNSYGCGYNGQTDGYIRESVDLSKYAGEKVTLRFDYVTDAAISGDGLLLDDVEIPQIGYASDFEQDNGGWEAEGFVRIENRLPQKFTVTIIENGRQRSVQYVELDSTNGAAITIDDPKGDAVTVVVSGTTRYTRQKASYGFSVTQLP